MKKQFLILALLTIVAWPGQAQNATDSGKTVFMARCAGCHNVNRVVTGPALAGVESRHDRSWINRFIHSPRSLIAQGDKEATALYVSFNKIQMPDHPDLTETDISHILAYIRDEASAKPTVQASDVPSVRHPDYLPIDISNFSFFGFYAVLVLVMAGSFLALIRIKDLARRNNSPADTGKDTTEALPAENPSQFTPGHTNI